MKNKIKIFISIFLVSFTILSTEIVLTRLFSVTLGYHFAFFVITLAMFGFSLGSVFIFIFKKKFLNIPVGKILFPALLLLSVSFIPILIVVPKISFSFGFEPKAYLLVLLLFLICQFPFFIAGLLFAYLFTYFAEESGKIYFFDLIGASIGALASVLIINYLGAINALIFLAIISSSALLLNSGYRKMVVPIGLLTILAIFAIINYRLNIFSPEQVKETFFNKWNSFSMIRVYGNENSLEPIPLSWGMSSEYQGTYPPSLSMDIDANAFSPIIKFDGDFKKIEFLKYNVISFAYYLLNEPDVLIIGPGGGQDVLAALAFNSKKIVGVEINSIIVNDVMKKRFKEYSGNLYNFENVEVVVDDARSYIRNSKDKYDFIQASLTDTWAAVNTGAYSLTENNIYTIEAIAEFINHLSSDGYLSISRWPGGDVDRLTAIYLKAAEDLGIRNANKHMVIIQGESMVTLLFKKSELNDGEINKIYQTADNMKFEILYIPDSKYNYEYTEMVESQNLDQYIKNNPNAGFQIPNDDSPFFFNNIPFRSVPSVLSGAVKNVGIFLLYGLFIISLFLSLIIIILPLCLHRKDLFIEETKIKLSCFAFFSLIGIGFILTEISFMQKLMIFLGHPTYSIVVVIFSLLFSAGIGSFFSSLIPHEKLKARLKIIVMIIIVIMLGYNLGLTPLFNRLLGLQIEFRILISVMLLSLLGVFLGMPFPIAIRLTGQKFRELIPFCWSLNGVFSVLGSILAVILAMNIGFTKTIYLAAGLYFIIFILIIFAEKFTIRKNS